MILGQSLFDAILDGLSGEKPDAHNPAYATRVRLRGLSESFTKAFPPAANAPDCARLLDDYFAYNGEGFAPAQNPPFESAAFQRITIEEIREDLELNALDSRAELHRKRRKFARLNHPDRVPEEWREAATIRMKTANQLIDQALRTMVPDKG